MKTMYSRVVRPADRIADCAPETCAAYRPWFDAVLASLEIWEDGGGAERPGREIVVGRGGRTGEQLSRDHLLHRARCKDLASIP